MKNLTLKMLAASALLVAANSGFAQAASAPAPSAAKKELINKMVQLQQPGIDSIARTILQQPLGGLMQGAGQALQQMPADKREATGKLMEAEIRKFVDEVGPMLRDRGAKLAGPTWTPILDERFTEDELKQIVAWLESPVSKKYQQVGGDMLNALGQKLAADMRPTLETRFKALDQAIAKHLGITPKTAAPAASPAKK